MEADNRGVAVLVRWGSSSCLGVLRWVLENWRWRWQWWRRGGEDEDDDNDNDNDDDDTSGGYGKEMGAGHYAWDLSACAGAARRSSPHCSY